MKRNNWPVTEKDVCPSGKPNQCCYCQQRIGSEHTSHCVCRERTVVVRVSFEFVAKVPESWKVETIEEQMSGKYLSCVNNVITLIDDTAERIGCACGFGKTKFVREATVDDEKRFKLYVGEDET